jgi:hypothetical protein
MHTQLPVRTLTILLITPSTHDDMHDVKYTLCSHPKYLFSWAVSVCCLLLSLQGFLLQYACRAQVVLTLYKTAVRQYSTELHWYY